MLAGKKAMKEQVSKLERLDIAAKAIIARNRLHREIKSLLFMGALCTVLGVFSTAPLVETLWVRIAAGSCIVLVLLFSVEWRYSFHVLILVLVGAAIVDYWLYPLLHLHNHWTFRILSAGAFLSLSFRQWRFAAPFATANKKIGKRSVWLRRNSMNY